MTASLRDIAETTGLFKSEAQTVMKFSGGGKLIATQMRFRTTTPKHRVVRHYFVGK